MGEKRGKWAKMSLNFQIGLFYNLWGKILGECQAKIPPPLISK